MTVTFQLQINFEMALNLWSTQLVPLQCSGYVKCESISLAISPASLFGLEEPL